MNRVSCIIAIAISVGAAGAGPCLAQNATEELLTLPMVRRFLTLGVAPDGEFTVCRDVPFKRLTKVNWGHCSRLPAKTPFSFLASTRDQIQVLWPQFNPLRQLTVVGTTKTADASNVGLNPFSAASLRAIGLADADAAIVENALAKVAKAGLAAVAAAGKNPLADLEVAIGAGSEVQVHLKEWSELTDGQSSVREMRVGLKKDIDALAANIAQVDKLREEAVTVLKRADAELPKPSPTPALPASPTTPAENPRYKWTSRVNEAVALALSIDPIARKRELLESLKELDVTLKTYDDSSRWIEDALVVESIETSLAETLAKKVSLTELQWKFEEGALSRKAKESAPISLRARAARRLVPEASAAIAHTRLIKPIYSAVTKDGKTTLQRGKNEGVDVKAAALINFVCRCFADTELYPMLQVGTTEIDGAPAVLFGGGIRLFGTTALAISAGGVAAWIRDLDNLEPGDEISSDLAITADLKRRLQIKAYFAVQYRF